MTVAAHSKGYMLFVVLSTIIIVALFANILMIIVVSQGRLTKHISSRTQAYYAARGAMYYAYEKLRSNDAVWVGPPPQKTFYFCRQTSGCHLPAALQVIDPDIPACIQELRVEVDAPGSGPHNSRRIQVIADYTLP